MKNRTTPDPTPEEIESKLFNKIRECIKSWDINVPEYYEWYCWANWSHVKMILDAINKDL